jgi:hypothetical protein
MSPERSRNLLGINHTIDFKKVLTPGVLYSETQLVDKNGNKKKYVVIAGSRGERFVMFAKGQ